MVRAVFKVPLRQTEGLMASVFTLMDLTFSALDHTTVSRRAVKLLVIWPAHVPHCEMDVLIDSIWTAGLWGRPMAGGEA
jgi:Transposase DDE domain